MRFHLYRTSTGRSDRYTTAPIKDCKFQPSVDEYGEKFKDFYVEISDLKELMAFVEKHGKILLKSDSIEIYDTYRE